jgi:hypothetical protein
MSAVRLKVEKLSPGATETQVRKALGQLGRVISVQLSGSSCLVEIESATVQKAIDSSGIGEIPLTDLVKVDSSGIGELRGATVRLA